MKRTHEYETPPFVRASSQLRLILCSERLGVQKQTVKKGESLRGSFMASSNSWNTVGLRRGRRFPNSSRGDQVVAAGVPRIYGVFSGEVGGWILNARRLGWSCTPVAYIRERTSPIPIWCRFYGRCCFFTVPGLYWKKKWNGGKRMGYEIATTIFLRSLVRWFDARHTWKPTHVCNICFETD